MNNFAIYPGSFDPITCGHMDVIERAGRIFDKIYLAIFINLKKVPFFSINERITLMKSIFKMNPKVHVTQFSGLVVDFSKQMEVSTIIRGLRAVSDFDYEFQLALTNRKLRKQLDTVFFMTDQKYSYLSSSLVREVACLGGDIGEFVPFVVEEAIRRKLNNE